MKGGVNHLAAIKEMMAKGNTVGISRYKRFQGIPEDTYDKLLDWAKQDLLAEKFTRQSTPFN